MTSVKGLLDNHTRSVIAVNERSSCPFVTLTSAYRSRESEDLDALLEDHIDRDASGGKTVQIASQIRGNDTHLPDKPTGGSVVAVALDYE